jgi:DNA-binding MarR family transcriptional regulator
LEAACYVRRERDFRDGRVWRLALTEEGEASVWGAAALWRDADAALRTELTAPSMEWLRTLAIEARSAWQKERSGPGDVAGLRAEGGSR